MMRGPTGLATVACRGVLEGLIGFEAGLEGDVPQHTVPATPYRGAGEAKNGRALVAPPPPNVNHIRSGVHVRVRFADGSHARCTGAAGFACLPKHTVQGTHDWTERHSSEARAALGTNTILKWCIHMFSQKVRGGQKHLTQTRRQPPFRDSSGLGEIRLRGSCCPPAAGA